MRIHPLLPMLFLLAAHTGAIRQALALLSALVPHELAHLLAARATGVRVREMELTPFGAAARLEGAWQISGGKVALVALAGPLVNLALALAFSTLAYAKWLPVHAARALIRPNILLLAVNLLPALPLDGGRAVCAALGMRIGPQKAARLFSRLGYALALFAVAFTVYTGAIRGVWNVTLPCCAAYLAACASREEEAARGATAEGLVYRRDEMRRLGYLPIRRLAVFESATVADALKLLRPGRVHVFTLHDEAMRPLGEIWENALLSASGRSGSPLRELLKAPR